MNATSIRSPVIVGPRPEEYLGVMKSDFSSFHLAKPVARGMLRIDGFLLELAPLEHRHGLSPDYLFGSNPGA